MILNEVHVDITRGHYETKTTTQKILCAGLWWPTLHKDAKEFYRSCDVCQCIGTPSRRDEMALNSQVTLRAFDKWAIDFVGPINPPEKRTVSRYIITVIDYLTRWDEVKPVKDCSVVTTT